ncbi:MAG TPA: hypothetical protein VHL31_13925 [Geminicoccus sp.]|uniref:hypothetical protein n=1 Tax=Geminicoccus sp. TaxID=2024832 RepID=UPI002E2F406A|nr:hypothetical protein [Geminicoccus sp.]HEX2527381.1 hypothetical protein [Geminicoccus sp.]
MMSLDGTTKERLPERLSGTMIEKALVDAHVHLYPAFDRDAFLRAAIDHARAAGAAFPWLLFTETARDAAFRELRNSPPTGWEVDLHGDGRTLTLRNAQGGRVMVTAGRQVQTAEGLELLAIGSDEPIADGTPLEAGLALALGHGALAVVPWGFGKWTGQRGRFLSTFLASLQGLRVFLGDNGGRPWFWPEPKPFQEVAATGRRVLPGSDPLPFKSHECRAGSYGLLIDVAVDVDRPFAALADLLKGGDTRTSAVGERAGSYHFVRDQIAMQIVKRARR